MKRKKFQPLTLKISEIHTKGILEKLPSYKDGSGLIDSILKTLLEDFHDNVWRDSLISETRRLKPSAFSKEFESPSSVFKRFEVEVSTLDDFFKCVAECNSNSLSESLVWRGQAKADWGLHSSLYRKLLEQSKISPDEDGGLPTGELLLPTEFDMVQAELAIIKKVREEWRVERDSVLQIMAELQHLSGLSRLIDVTRNPLVALWFAVTNEFSDHADEDGRLFALGANKSMSLLHQDAISHGGEHGYLSMPWGPDRTLEHWGDGEGAKIWFPESYIDRIAAQSAGFLLDGIPKWGEGIGSRYRKTSANKSEGIKATYWNRTEVLYSASVLLNFQDPEVMQRKQKLNRPSTHTIRIPAQAKEEIRNELKRHFGITYSQLFPDREASAKSVSKMEFDFY